MVIAFPFFPWKYILSSASLHVQDGLKQKTVWLRTSSSDEGEMPSKKRSLSNTSHYSDKHKNDTASQDSRKSDQCKLLASFCPSAVLMDMLHEHENLQGQSSGKNWQTFLKLSSQQETPWLFLAVALSLHHLTAPDKSKKQCKHIQTISNNQITRPDADSFTRHHMVW